MYGRCGNDELIAHQSGQNLIHRRLFTHFLSHRLQNEHTTAFFLVMSSARWLGLYLDLLCALFVVAVAIVGLVAIQDHGILLITV